MHKDLLADLLMFWSAKEQKYITLDEYIEKMPEDQKVHLLCRGRRSRAPGQTAQRPAGAEARGYDLLLCTEDVDEFCLQIMRDYKEKEFTRT